MSIYNMQASEIQADLGGVGLAATNSTGRVLRRSAFLYAVSLLLLTACAAKPRDNFNPFKDYGGTSVYFTMECSKKIGDQCVQATCKADQTSNCGDFAKGCLNNDGYYQGSGAGGTCSLIM
jgi:hypothetical protein